MTRFVSLILMLLLAGCSINHAAPQAVYDLGPMQPAPQPAMQPIALSPLVVAASTVPSWLDSSDMLYRLNYADDGQLHSYGGSRWSVPPMQLFDQRLKARLAESGMHVLAPGDPAQNVNYTLHIDADDFSQTFDRVDHAYARVALRASLFDGRKLVAQTTLRQRTDTRSADATGGVHALSGASDAAIADIMRWLASLNLKQ